MKELLPALAAAIAAMDDPKKNKKNDHFRNQYADLGVVLECIFQPLADNGLVLTQTVAWQDPMQLLLTRVWHIKSGEFMESVIPLVPEKQTPQGYAIALTYARRYAIKAMFGMHDVDNDGNPPGGKGTNTANRATAAAPRSNPDRDGSNYTGPSTTTKPKAPGPIVVADLAEPFELVEHAVAAIQQAKSKDELRGLQARCKASKFMGEDVAIIREALTARLNFLGTEVAI